MLYIFEMANNHQGSVAHAKRIIEEFAAVAQEMGVNAAIKFQFRQLDTFVHDDFKESDLKFVKRFRSTRLTKDEFKEILDHVRSHGLTTIATPFDNESLPWLENLDVDVVKVASCSVDDWPLLNAICKINKKIIISTGGASMTTLRKVYELFKHNQRDFAFMHCVGEYPTPVEASNLNRIRLMKEEFPDIEVGLSTHESPLERSLAPEAVAMGCTILEKHVGVPTEEISLNAYSNTPAQMKETIQNVQRTFAALYGTSETEVESLGALKRGVYLKNTILPGHLFAADDFYYAMPCQEGQFNVSSVPELLEMVATTSIPAGKPLLHSASRTQQDESIIQRVVTDTLEILKTARIPLSGKESVEISAHYGLDIFGEVGALIIDKVNREYCKKIIVVFPGQTHPVHHHIKKEEAFELLHGDCVLTLNSKAIKMKKGDPILINRGVKHGFESESGCVIEEISTTHVPGDSVYEDARINTLPLTERKVKISLQKKN